MDRPGRLPRVPPGQGVTPAWPVLHVGAVPAFDPRTWRLVVHGAVRRRLELSWGDFGRLPRRERAADMHCVTGWSRLDMRWGGVALETLLEAAGRLPGAAFVRFADDGFYDTSVPLELALENGALLADTEAGRPLSPEHGAPLRAVVPGRYAWKSCKWLAEIELMEEERLGFWELRGYRNGADPWLEQRFV